VGQQQRASYLEGALVLLPSEDQIARLLRFRAFSVILGRSPKFILFIHTCAVIIPL
jgi:hypothetical protein